MEGPEDIAGGPNVAMAITSEFTATSIRYIMKLEEALEATLVTGTATLMAGLGMEHNEAKLRFMDQVDNARERWPALEQQAHVYKNLLSVMTEEIKRWETEHGN
jgi:hypothetical protein